MRTFTDEHIEYWGEVYVRENLSAALGIPFISFLRAPHTYLQLLQDSVAADAAPLLPAQQQVLLRMTLDEMDSNSTALNVFHSHIKPQEAAHVGR